MMSPDLSVWMSSRAAASACLTACGTACSDMTRVLVASRRRGLRRTHACLGRGCIVLPRQRRGVGAARAERADAGHAVVELRDRGRRHARDGLVGRGHLRLQLVAHLLGAALVRQLATAPGWPRCGSRAPGGRPGAAACRPACCRRACRARAPRSEPPCRSPAVQHLHQARQGALAADLRQRIDGALAHPPVLVAWSPG